MGGKLFDMRMSRKNRPTQDLDNTRTNMADKKEGRKLRGPYKKYVRHFNPYEFEAARRAKKRQDSTRDHQQLMLSNNSFSDDEFDLIFSCKSHDTNMDTCDTLAGKDTEGSQLLSYNQDFGDPLHEHEIDNTVYENETEDRTPFEHEMFVEENHDQSGEVLNDREDSDEENDLGRDNGTLMYECFLNDSNSSDNFSDNEEINSDIESTDGINEPEHGGIDDLLYADSPITATSSIVLLLSFVLKHKLTRVAFNDLLAVIQAHCPRLNNCQTTIKKLFDFVSQAKGNIVKHFFCGFCKAYQGTTAVKDNCNICGKQLEKNHAHFIEVPLVKQLQNYYAGK